MLEFSYVYKEEMRPGFNKYHLNPTGALPWPFRPVLHEFTSPDTSDPHDHPFDIRVHVIEGQAQELVYNPLDFSVQTRIHSVGDSFIIPAEQIHKLVSLPSGPYWSLCCYGPITRKVHFWRMQDGKVQKRPFDSSSWETVQNPRRANSHGY